MNQLSYVATDGYHFLVKLVRLSVKDENNRTFKNPDIRVR